MKTKKSKIMKLKRVYPSNLVSVQKYYGIQSDYDENNKGFISRANYYDGKYIALAPKGVTHGNGWSNLENDSLESMMKHLLDKNWIVFEFDTYRELFNWLAK